tara:strand:+ start:67 stop:261 length:195 start_codon:yes stop_codon:yes gene_type:complete
MANEENKTEITKLSTWDMADTVVKWEEYKNTTLPEPTARNMKLYMDKINELTEAVNRLAAINLI